MSIIISTYWLSILVGAGWPLVWGRSGIIHQYLAQHGWQNSRITHFLTRLAQA